MHSITAMKRQERRDRKSSLDFIGVWVVEDDASYREILVTSLNSTSDIRCEHDFSSCEEALELLEKEYAPEVVLMDIGLPKGCMSGIDGTIKVKAISPATDVIMLTIHGEDKNVFDAIVAGASGYLLKSPEQSFDEIALAIKEVVHGGGSPMNPFIARKVMEMFSKMVKPKAEYVLTEREKEILHLLAQGLTKNQIAEKLFISFYTVDTHIKNMYDKMHVHKLSEAIAKGFRERPY